MTPETIEHKIREYLTTVVHLSLATSRDNRPWVCEVHYSFDEGLNLYFLSSAARRHSIEIAANPHVAGNIVTQHDIGQNPRGVYFEGLAERLEGVEESHPAYISYRERFGVGPETLANQSAAGHSFYKITVNTFYLFDARESNPPQKYVLPWIKIKV